MTETASEYPKSKGNQSGTNYGYTVEARLSDHVKPFELGGIVLTDKWQTMYFEQGPVGVPSVSVFDRVIAHFNLMSYASAQALRWWIHAQNEVMTPGSRLGLETRIVKHRVKYEMSCEAMSDHMYIHGEDRSSILPDWNQKATPVLTPEEEYAKALAFVENHPLHAQQCASSTQDGALVESEVLDATELAAAE